MFCYDLDAFDLVHAGISGGKDSTALLLWLIYESGVERERIRATFCDTGNEDDLTLAYVAMLSREVHPIETIYPERNFWQLVRHKGLFPSRKVQFCTQMLKIVPTREHIRNLLAHHDQVLLTNGVRHEEGHRGNTRATAPAWEFDTGFWCWLHRPLVEMRLRDIWQLHRRYLRLEWVADLIAADPLLSADHQTDLIERQARHGIPRNPIYEMGAARCGCFPCVNSRKAEVRAVATYRPQKIAQIGYEEWTVNNRSTFFHRSYTPAPFRRRTVQAKGGAFQVCSIDDVADWSRTAYGGRQYELDLHLEDSELLACRQEGFCE
jgi:3'-phosphoadenosine 5'-phosphosulfate sulfotransferase (PAPS reductase)/FAD synthetase